MPGTALAVMASTRTRTSAWWREAVVIMVTSPDAPCPAIVRPIFTAGVKTRRVSGLRPCALSTAGATGTGTGRYDDEAEHAGGTGGDGDGLRYGDGRDDRAGWPVRT